MSVENEDDDEEEEDNDDDDDEDDDVADYNDDSQVISCSATVLCDVWCHVIQCNERWCSKCVMLYMHGLP